MQRLKHPFGFWTLTALVIANMIGVGVFTTSGFALADLGSPRLVLAAWLVGGAIAVCGALGYGALARLVPASGGEYLFLSRAIHPLAGFLGGWVSLLAGFTSAISIAAITFVAYATPGLNDTWQGNLLASVVIVVAAALHGISVRPGAAAQNVVVAVKLAAVAAFCIYALTAGDVASWPGLRSGGGTTQPGAVSAATLGLTLMWISFSYSGFNAAVYLAGEVPDGARRVPRALLAGTAITMAVYLALNAIFVLSVPLTEAAGQYDIAAIAAAALGGPALDVAVRALISVALLTSVSAMIMIGPRVYAKMADDGLMPKALQLRGAAPSTAIWMQAGLAVAVVWIAGLRQLLSYLGFTLGLSTAATVACVYVIVRRTGADTSRLPGYPWAPAAYTVCTLVFAALGALRSPLEMAAAIATIASGWLLYVLLARSPSGAGTGA